MAEVQRDTIGSREDTLRFLELVSLFQTQAMIALGKLANPMTQKTERNLDSARLMIDTLEMLEKKTTGNLNSDESRMLKVALTDLRIMYVEESKKPDTPPAPPTPSAPPPPEESKVKFHKTYE